jgi:hypothetical protein
MGHLHIIHGERLGDGWKYIPDPLNRYDGTLRLSASVGMIGAGIGYYRPTDDEGQTIDLSGFGQVKGFPRNMSTEVKRYARKNKPPGDVKAHWITVENFLKIPWHEPYTCCGHVNGPELLAWHKAPNGLQDIPPEIFYRGGAKPVEYAQIVTLDELTGLLSKMAQRICGTAEAIMWKHPEEKVKKLEDGVEHTLKNFYAPWTHERPMYMAMQDFFGTYLPHLIGGQSPSESRLIGWHTY